MLRQLVFVSLLSLAFANILIGDLTQKAHNVSGTLYAINTRTLRLENFYYDGLGPAAAFWLDIGPAATTAGRIIPFRDNCEPKQQIRKYTGEVVELELPQDLTLADIGYFSVWCIQAKAEFGGIPIDASALQDLVVLDKPTCPVRQQEQTTDIFPVKAGWNCEPLSGIYQVRWLLDPDQTKINFELVARLRDGDQWMGFGPSGSDTETKMVGSDVAIAYRRDDEFFAIDYHLQAQQPCTNPPVGVCPDTLRNETDGVDDVQEVSGDFKDGVTIVRYSRPVKVTDTQLDKDIITDGPSFVTWAHGPLQLGSNLPLFHLDLEGPSFPRESVSIEFGREPKNNCARGFEVPVEEPADLPGFERPVLYNVTSITARIGPSGGERGVSAIIGGPSWGIAWYLSETGAESKDILIPVLGVERGKTYTFSVFGGIPIDDKDTSVHPFYITSSSVGGYQGKNPGQRANEEVYAGIEDIKKNKADGVTSFTATGVGALCKLATNATDTSAIETYDDFYNTLSKSCTKNAAITANGGKLVWEVKEDTPDVVYYQSVTHETIGYKIRVFDSGKVDVPTLRELSGGGPLEDPDSVDVSCIGEFNGARRRFMGCARRVGGLIDVFWNVNEATDEIETLFRAPKGENTGYVGLGWGFDRMVGSSAVIALDLENGAVIGDYLLAAQNPAGVQPNNKQQLTSAEVDSSGEFIRGLFTRPLEADGLPPIEIGRTNLIWAVGARPGSPRDLQRHSRRGAGTVDLTESQGEQAFVGDEENLETVFIIHGVFMGISWLVLVPIAITGIRFFKKYNPATFYVHVGVNVTAGLLTTAGFIMALIAGNRTERKHFVIGCIVFSLVIVQVAIGVIRPHKGKPLRNAWFFVHAIVGSGLVTLAIVNCFFGVATPKIGGPIGWYIAMGVAAGLFVFVNLVLFLMPKRFPRTEEEEREGLLGEETSRGRTFVRED